MTKLCHPDTAIYLRDDRFKDQRIAFAVRKDLGLPADTWTLAVVVADEPGFHALPWQVANGPETVMQAHADDLNDNVLKLTRELANAYVASSMRGAGRTDR